MARRRKQLIQHRLEQSLVRIHKAVAETTTAGQWINQQISLEPKSVPAAWCDRACLKV
jgi:hypothetical protein